MYMAMNCICCTFLSAAGFQYGALASSALVTNARPTLIARDPAPYENGLTVPASWERASPGASAKSVTHRHTCAHEYRARARLKKRWFISPPRS
jgi:hypothetical protein